MRSQLRIEIDAPPALVFAVASDPTRWPALLPHYRRVAVLREERPAPGGVSLVQAATSLARTAPHSVAPPRAVAPPLRAFVARYVAVRQVVPLLGLGLPVAWSSAFRADPATLELHFRHVAGATAGMAVTWRIRGRGRGTVVTLEHVFAGPAWLPGPAGGAWFARLVDRVFVRPIAGQTLATLRAICESLPPSWDEAAEESPAAARAG